jgi:hydrogenase maturation protease
MDRPAAVVLGLGNDLLTDDGFGPAVAAACLRELAGDPSVQVRSASVAGFHLLDLLAGFDRALIVDVVQTGTRPAGTILECPLEKASAGRTLGGSHQMDLATALSLGRRVGLPLPSTVRLLVAEAKDLETFCEALSPELAAAVPLAAARVRQWVETGDLRAEAPAWRRDGERTTV